MQTTKIQFSEDELTLMSNARWMLMKNDIIQKVDVLLGNIQVTLKSKLAAENYAIPEACKKYGAKISHGEKYEGLPYMILDYPRFFSKESIFAFRILFWWGNYFSCTLHLSGAVKNNFVNPLAFHFEKLKDNNYYISAAEDEWVHHVSEPHYIAIKELQPETFHQLLQQQPFVKITKTYPLSQWENFEEEAINTFDVMMSFLV